MLLGIAKFQRTIYPSKQDFRINNCGLTNITSCDFYDNNNVYKRTAITWKKIICNPYVFISRHY